MTYCSKVVISIIQMPGQTEVSHFDIVSVINPARITRKLNYQFTKQKLKTDSSVYNQPINFQFQTLIFTRQYRYWYSNDIIYKYWRTFLSLSNVSKCYLHTISGSEISVNEAQAG